MKKIMFLALAMIVALAPACARKKQAAKTLSLHQNMTMGQVILHMGEPETVVPSMVDSRGNRIDIWEYNLGIRDEEMHNTKIMFQVGGWFLFWPLLCFPQAWKSSSTYETYFFKFVNKMLSRWGKKVDVIDVQNEYSLSI
jgi:hypothetical protein